MRHIHYKIIGIAFIGWLLAACQNRESARIETALTMAGENRAELQKVLDHYRGDREKSKAARFLIANMIPHHTYGGWEIDSLRRVRKRRKPYDQIDEKLMKRWKGFNYRNGILIRDVEVAKADVLIENIDLAFEAWKKRPWSKHYSWEDFCEYVLPYRVGDEPFENWRRTYYERYAPVLDSLYQGSDVVEAARLMANYLKAEKFWDFKDFDLPHFGALYLLHTRSGYCREECDIATYVMRAVGIPIATDFYEMSPSYNSRHFWTAIIDTTGLAMPFSYTERELKRGGDALQRKKGKVYRICYSLQKEKYEGMYTDKSIPAFFRNPLMKDVSNEYFPNMHAKISLPSNAEGDWMYLGLFMGEKMKLIDIAPLTGKKAMFKHVEPDAIYFPCTRANGTIAYCGYAFLLGKDSIRYFIPDTTQRSAAVLTRKYPMRINPEFLARNIGVKIEGANRKDFSDAELLYQIVDTPEVYTVIPDIHKKFRYIRHYYSPSSLRIEIGEWYMYTKNATHPITEYTLHSSVRLNDYQRKSLQAIADGDWSSFYRSPHRREKLTFDLGKPTWIDHCVLIPRNDDNFIHPGDVYELFYHDGTKGWKSLGKREATGLELHYDNVPGNALLWLRNHTRGKEERCFYMENGKQIFI